MWDPWPLSVSRLCVCQANARFYLHYFILTNADDEDHFEVPYTAFPHIPLFVYESFKPTNASTGCFSTSHPLVHETLVRQNFSEQLLKQERAAYMVGDEDSTHVYLLPPKLARKLNLIEYGPFSVCVFCLPHCA